MRTTALAVRAAGDRFAQTGSTEDLAAWHRAQKAARPSLARFRRTALVSFARAAARWRSEALRSARGAGAPAPAWVADLPVPRY